MTVQDVVDIYQENLKNYDYFSDPQKAWIYDGHICVCIRDYNHYITKEKIEDVETAIRALFEIERLDEYIDGEDPEADKLRLKYSYWTTPY